MNIQSCNLNLTNRVKKLVNKRIQNLSDNAYIKAFVLGDKSLMTYDVQEKIQENGVSHLFALSGMHLSFFVVFLNKILKKWRLKKIFIYSFLIFYLILASFPVSFIRAILLMLSLDLNSKFNFNISKIKILFLIASLLLFYDPFYIYDLGFLYSFIVTFSLLYANNILQTKPKIYQLFLISTITFLYSAPITISSNYEINLLAIINNIILVPFVSTIVFPLTILTFCFGFVYPIFNIVINILENINSLLNNFSFFLIVGKVNLLEIIIYYFLLCFIIKIKNKKWVSLMIVYCLFLYNKNLWLNNSSITYLDVGQGDCALITAPKNEKVFLIDTGGKISFPKESWQKVKHEFNITDNIITFLKSKRIRHIDYLIITHGDYDHMGNAINLVNNFLVKEVIFNNNELNDLERQLIKLLDEKNIKYYQNIEQLGFMNTKLYFLNTKIYDNENDNSNVLFLNYLNYKFLFMGDAGIAKEKDLLTKYNLKEIDFLKVGHHGSDTSSSEDFINAINPRYSLISVGKNNRYNHPKNSVLNTLKNSKILRTDIDGSIEIILTKNGYKIKNYSP